MTTPAATKGSDGSRSDPSRANRMMIHGDAPLLALHLVRGGAGRQLWVRASPEQVVIVERLAHEANLAWALALTAKPRLNVVDRNAVFVAIGAGQTFVAIGHPLKSVATKRIPVQPAMVWRCTSWLDTYVGHEDER